MRVWLIDDKPPGSMGALEACLILSRRQRRQIRDIAQSLLDTEFLYSSEVNGTTKPSSESAQAPKESLP